MTGDIPHVDGLILTADLIAAGEDARTYRRARERNQLVGVHRGVFADPRYWAQLSPEDRYLHQILGAARSSRSTPTLSHVSAAALWGAPLLAGAPTFVHVLSTKSTGSRTEGGFRRHATAHPEVDITELQGLRVTALARTMAEFAQIMPFSSAVAAIDWAIRPSTVRKPKPSTTKEEILAAAARLEIIRGHRKIQRAVEFSDGLSGSPGESLSRVQLLTLGFPRPELQKEFRDQLGLIGFVDFWWPEFNVIGEFDGVGKYIRHEFTDGKTTAEVVIAEKNRENRLRAVGPGVTRWDWPTLHSPGRLLEQLVSAGLPSSRRSR